MQQTHELVEVLAGYIEDDHDNSSLEKFGIGIGIKNLEYCIRSYSKLVR